MTRSKRWAAIGMLGVLVPLGAECVRAEVSTEISETGAHFLVMEEVPFSSHTEDPNPVGIVWIPVRTIPQTCFLNPDGLARGDRRPDAARLANGMPAAVWTYVPGGSASIAYSEWTGSAWQPTEFLADGPGWNWDPRIHVAPDGAVHVVWWEQTARVLSRSRPAGSTVWDPAEQVTGLLESGRRPSVAAFDGRLWVAYERDSNLPGVTREVVVAVRNGAGAFVHEVVAGSTREGSLDVSIHYEEGRLWLDWRQDENEHDHVEWTGSGWSAPVAHGWSDYTWLGLEMIRRQIRRDVLLLW